MNTTVDSHSTNCAMKVLFVFFVAVELSQPFWIYRLKWICRRGNISALSSMLSEFLTSQPAFWPTSQRAPVLRSNIGQVKNNFKQVPPLITEISYFPTLDTLLDSENSQVKIGIYYLLATSNVHKERWYKNKSRFVKLILWRHLFDSFLLENSHTIL